jgi:hypothetical protein
VTGVAHNVPPGHWALSSRDFVVISPEPQIEASGGTDEKPQEAPGAPSGVQTPSPQNEVHHGLLTVSPDAQEGPSEVIQVSEAHVSSSVLPSPAAQAAAPQAGTAPGPGKPLKRAAKTKRRS